MNVIILCAGLGTRLRPLSEWRAKPLVPVGDRPALAHVLERVRAAGARRIAVNAHHRAEDLRAYLPSDVVLSEEAVLLGTAGGVARAAEGLDEGDVLVWNGDILGDIDVHALFEAHRADATLVVSTRARAAAGEGNVGLDGAGRVVRLRRETIAAGEIRSADFLGIHVLGARLRGALPAEGDLVGDVYLPALRRGVTLGVFEHAGAWWDIGTIESYRLANAAWLDGRGLRSYVAPTARVSGATLVASIVGEGATVEGSGALERCIVWPGAHARAPLADAIVAPAGVVRA